jgi:MFS family permease
VAGLDATAVNVALPAIRADLGGGLAGQQWVSNAYLLTLGSLILVGGSLGDLLGERRVFLVGVAGFGAVSLLCAISPSIEVLIACRAVQGAFGALLTPSALAVIVAAFPHNERGAAIGSWTAWCRIARVVGPLAGGFVVDAVSWRLSFAVNIPFVVTTLVLVSRAVPAQARGRRCARSCRLAWRRTHVPWPRGTGAGTDSSAGRRLEQPRGVGAGPGRPRAAWHFPAS